MLVLSRKVGEQLIIGDDVTITITKSSSNRVTVGIDAPRDVSILRGEILANELGMPPTQPSQSCDARVAAKSF
jgi:carbon storage regulator